MVQGLGLGLGTRTGRSESDAGRRRPTLASRKVKWEQRRGKPGMGHVGRAHGVGAAAWGCEALWRSGSGFGIEAYDWGVRVPGRTQGPTSGVGEEASYLVGPLGVSGRGGSLCVEANGWQG